jgi:hypothetical protein
MPRWTRILALLAVTCVTVVSAQPISSGWGRRALPYDGHFTFVRVRWRGGTYGVRVPGEGPNMWLHEFPRAERNLMTILDDLTLIDARSSGRSGILSCRRARSLRQNAVKMAFARTVEISPSMWAAIHALTACAGSESPTSIKSTVDAIPGSFARPRNPARPIGCRAHAARRVARPSRLTLSALPRQFQTHLYAEIPWVQCPVTVVHLSRTDPRRMKRA